jgi:hypothetical protein
MMSKSRSPVTTDRNKVTLLSGVGKHDRKAQPPRLQGSARNAVLKGPRRD